MLYYHTEAQRQFVREHTEELAREMRRKPDPTTPDDGVDRWTSRVTRFVLGSRRARGTQLRARIHHG